MKYAPNGVGAGAEGRRRIINASDAAYLDAHTVYPARKRLV
jgi:hypothetical protein